jgi:hypothetical protein
MHSKTTDKENMSFENSKIREEIEKRWEELDFIDRLTGKPKPEIATLYESNERSYIEDETTDKKRDKKDIAQGEKEEGNSQGEKGT